MPSSRNRAPRPRNPRVEGNGGTESAGEREGARCFLPPTPLRHRASPDRGRRFSLTVPQDPHTHTQCLGDDYIGSTEVRERAPGADNGGRAPRSKPGRDAGATGSCSFKEARSVLLTEARRGHFSQNPACAAAGVFGSAGVPSRKGWWLPLTWHLTSLRWFSPSLRASTGWPAGKLRLASQ